MNSYMGIIVGGLMPALLFGIAGIFVKTSTKYGISPSYYLLCAGIGVLCFSGISFIFLKDQMVNLKSASHAMILGILWAGGTVLMMIGILKFNVPISVAAPIAGTNSLVTILLGFLVYSEWREINIYKFIIGVVLIIAGSLLVAQSK